MREDYVAKLKLFSHKRGSLTCSQSSPWLNGIGTDFRVAKSDLMQRRMHLLCLLRCAEHDSTAKKGILLQWPELIEGVDFKDVNVMRQAKFHYRSYPLEYCAGSVEPRELPNGKNVTAVVDGT